MQSYLDLLRHVLDRGERVPTRAVLRSTGKKVHAVSVFGHQWRHDLRDGFPLLTTKKVSLHNVLHELVWFLRGSTNVGYLRDNGVSIWDQWADGDGDLGPVYGKQWRSFESVDWSTKDVTSVDQVAAVLRDIALVRDDPSSSPRRRLIVTAWNPAQVKDMGLPPCHTLFQFGVSGGGLSCHLFARSIDAFLGLPYNIASYAALTHLFAAMTGLRPRELVVSFSDLHIYENHLDQVAEQLARGPLPLPAMRVDPPDSVDSVGRGNFVMLGYQYHPPLKAEVAV
jgi:thymidylate synthase